MRAYSKEKIFSIFYVDYLLLLVKDEKTIINIKPDLTLKLAANDMGKASYLLEMNIIQKIGAFWYRESTLVLLKRSFVLQTPPFAKCRARHRRILVPAEMNLQMNSFRTGADWDLIHIATRTKSDVAVVTTMLTRFV